MRNLLNILDTFTETMSEFIGALALTICLSLSLITFGVMFLSWNFTDFHMTILVLGYLSFAVSAYAALFLLNYILNLIVAREDKTGYLRDELSRERQKNVELTERIEKVNQAADGKRASST